MRQNVVQVSLGSSEAVRGIADQDGYCYLLLLKEEARIDCADRLGPFPSLWEVMQGSWQFESLSQLLHLYVGADEKGLHVSRVAGKQSVALTMFFKVLSYCGHYVPASLVPNSILVTTEVPAWMWDVDADTKVGGSPGLSLQLGCREWADGVLADVQDVSSEFDAVVYDMAQAIEDRSLDGIFLSGYQYLFLFQDEYRDSLALQLGPRPVVRRLACVPLTQWRHVDSISASLRRFESQSGYCYLKIISSADRLLALHSYGMRPRLMHVLTGDIPLDESAMVSYDLVRTDHTMFHLVESDVIASGDSREKIRRIMNLDPADRSRYDSDMLGGKARSTFNVMSFADTQEQRMRETYQRLACVRRYAMLEHGAPHDVCDVVRCGNVNSVRASMFLATPGECQEFDGLVLVTRPWFVPMARDEFPKAKVVTLASLEDVRVPKVLLRIYPLVVDGSSRWFENSTWRQLSTRTGVAVVTEVWDPVKLFMAITAHTDQLTIVGSTADPSLCKAYDGRLISKFVALTSFVREFGSHDVVAIDRSTAAVEAAGLISSCDHMDIWMFASMQALDNATIVDHKHCVQFRTDNVTLSKFACFGHAMLLPAATQIVLYDEDPVLLARSTLLIVAKSVSMRISKLTDTLVLVPLSMLSGQLRDLLGALEMRRDSWCFNQQAGLMALRTGGPSLTWPLSMDSFVDDVIITSTAANL